MTTTAAIFTGFSVTCFLIVIAFIIRDISGSVYTITRKQILMALAFLATWAVIAGLLRWLG